MKVVFSLNELQYIQLVSMFQNEWWSKGRNLIDAKNAVANSSFVVGVVNDDEKLIGFARVLTDTIYKALILDVIVDVRYRNKGFGDLLMGEILKHIKIKKVNHIELFCKDEMISYYKKFGFEILSGENEMRRILK